MKSLREILDVFSEVRGMVLDLAAAKSTIAALEQEIRSLRASSAASPDSVAPSPPLGEPALGSPSGGAGAEPPLSIGLACEAAQCVSWRGAHSSQSCSWGHSDLCGSACADYVDRRER